MWCGLLLPVWMTAPFEVGGGWEIQQRASVMSLPGNNPQDQIGETFRIHSVEIFRILTDFKHQRKAKQTLLDAVRPGRSPLSVKL